MTRIVVDPAPGRARVTHSPGPIAVRVQRVDERGARVALVATQALLLGGDQVHLDVTLGPHAWLDVVETAGTVAYNGRGAAAGWTVRATVGAGATLTWHAEPFVIADGAHVTRSTRLELAAGAAACVRETLVLGRAGERGGALRATTHVVLDGRDLLVEDLDLTDPPARHHPGLLGRHRVIDTVLLAGERAPREPTLPVGMRYDLGGPGTLARKLAGDTDPALDSVWRRWSGCAGRSERT